MNTTGREHTLYRLYDQFDDLLYIGITTNLEQRMANHRCMPWAKYVTRIETEPVGTDWHEALRLEKLAIMAEAPLKNSDHSTLPPEPLNAEWQRWRSWVPMFGYDHEAEVAS